MATTFRRTWYAYLIRLDRPLGGQRHKASFYLGIANDWMKRYELHCKGKGAKMLACAVARGIPFSVVKLWEYPSYGLAREFELWAKLTLKNHKRLLHLPDVLDEAIEQCSIAA